MTDKVIYCDDRGVILHGTSAANRSWDRPGTAAVLIPWAKLRRVEATDPWPSVIVVGDAVHGPLRGFLLSKDELHALADHVARFIEAARERSGALVDPGWTARPKTTWEPTSMPSHGDEASYREGASEAVLAAHRSDEGGGLVGRLVQRLRAKSPKKYAVEDPAELAIVKTCVYAKAPDGKAFRVERPSLAGRSINEEQQVVYLFGQHRELISSGERGDSSKTRRS